MARPALPKLGDIVEIETKKGLAYAQYINRRERTGDVIRILPGLYKARPPGFSELTKQHESFITLFPLRRAVGIGIFKVVGREEIPDRCRPFPLFRSGIADKDGKVHVWWLWDGEREWKIGQLSPEHKLLPIRSIPNDTLLIERIEAGWTPEKDTRT